MRRKRYRRFLVVLLLLTITVGSGLLIEERKEEAEVSVESISDDLLIPGGMPVGIYMETDGVMVLGTEKVKALNGKKYEPADRLVKAGDYIVAVDNEKVQNKKELMEKVEELTEEEVVLKLRREGEILNVKMEPVECEKGEYKLGIWVRDNTQGIGTLTFVDQNGNYGALGHGISDVDTGELLHIDDGDLYQAQIVGIQKGSSGSPGELSGLIHYEAEKIIGSIEKNCEQGIYGKLSELPEELGLRKMEVAYKQELEIGPASILCCVDGTVREFDAEITRIDMNHEDTNKSFVIQVTDPELLELTGGIVQGMSGSPVIQNGKFVGAVTHVFIQDSTGGYGIFAENMLENI